MRQHHQDECEQRKTKHLANCSIKPVPSITLFFVFFFFFFFFLFVFCPNFGIFFPMRAHPIISLTLSSAQVIAYQLHHRIEEATSRDLAESLNMQVWTWSLAQAIVMVVVAVGQVFLVQRLFKTDKPRIGNRRPI